MHYCTEKLNESQKTLLWESTPMSNLTPSKGVMGHLYQHYLTLLQELGNLKESNESFNTALSMGSN